MHWLYLVLLGFLACALQLTVRIAVVVLLIAILLTISAIAAAVFALAGFLLFRFTANRMFQYLGLIFGRLARLSV